MRQNRTEVRVAGACYRGNVDRVNAKSNIQRWVEGYCSDFLLEEEKNIQRGD